MPNFKLIIEYKGTNYSGWQRQKNHKTIQGEIEKVLRAILKQKIDLIGSGRTDAGVHALGQVANFYIETDFPKDKILKALNFHLLDDIRIKKISQVNSNFHSRFSAKRKLYRYVIIKEYSPFWKDKAYFYPWTIDLKRINKTAKYFIGRHNFSSLQNQGSSRKTPVLNLNKIIVRERYLSPGRRSALIFEIEADAFLYRMVRNLVGLLLEVGRGKITPKRAKFILQKHNRRFAPPPVPAHGLYLYKVKY